MPQVTMYYRVIVTAGHHRQPRSSSTWVEPDGPNPVQNSNAVPGSLWAGNAPPTYPYPKGAQTPPADFLFWSAGDGTNGQTGANPYFNCTVGNDPLTVVAWYLPEGGGNGPSGYVIDAFSDAINDFVDDDFVSVSPDAALTADANVVGWVPTNNGETLTAVPGTIHTGEVFEAWIGGQPVGHTATDQLDRDEAGYAVATYHRQNVPVPPNVGRHDALGWLILFGIINDAPGLQIPLGGGPGDPVGPWGPYLQRAARAATVASIGASTAGGAEIARLAMGEIEAATKQLEADISRGAGAAGNRLRGN